MLNTSASGSARPVVSTTIISGATSDDLGYCSLEFTEQRAATQPPELCDPYVFAFDHFSIDRDLAKFIHHDGDLRGRTARM